MKKISQPASQALVALCLTLFCGPGYTQTSVLAYEGNVMTGTSTVDVGTNSDGVAITSPPISTVGAFDADITLSGSLAKNDLAISSFVIDVTLNNGTIFSFENLGGGLPILTASDAGGVKTTETSVCDTGSSSTNGCLTLTTKGNTVSGATFDLTDTEGHSGESMTLSIGPNGDSFSYTATRDPTCGTGVATDVGIYVGAAGDLPCSVGISNSKAGAWVVARSAPESSTLSLLIIGIVGLGLRRKLRLTAAT
jgi:hypothetical protein